MIGKLEYHKKYDDEQQKNFAYIIHILCVSKLHPEICFAGSLIKIEKSLFFFSIRFFLFNWKI